MLRTIIFDFDGIIVDSEPIIMKLTHEMAAHEGWAVSEEEYYRDYLALDDRGIVEYLFTSHGRAVDHARVEELVNTVSCCMLRSHLTHLTIFENTTWPPHEMGLWRWEVPIPTMLREGAGSRYVRSTSFTVQSSADKRGPRAPHVVAPPSESRKAGPGKRM